MARTQEPREDRTGAGVDPRGGPVVDPTKNVEDLVEANKTAAKELREADLRFNEARFKSQEDFYNFAREAEKGLQNFARDAQGILFKSMLDAETRRIDQLADLRQDFQDAIKDMLARSVESNSTLVASQLLQIQATFNERVTKLEAYQFTQAGRSSVSDPALTDALARVTRELADLKMNQEASLTRVANTISTVQLGEAGVSGRGIGRMDTNARLLSVVMAVAAVASPVIAILVTIMAMRGHG